MARYFVTGAIARQLVARGDQVVALARAPERAARPLEDGLELTLEHEVRLL